MYHIFYAKEMCFGKIRSIITIVFPKDLGPHLVLFADASLILYMSILHCFSWQHSLPLKIK